MGQAPPAVHQRLTERAGRHFAEVFEPVPVTETLQYRPLTHSRMPLLSVPDVEAVGPLPVQTLRDAR